MTASTSDAVALTVSRDDQLVARFAALAIVIHILEASLPSPLPGIKPGLANVITLIVLLRHGLRMAIWVALLRVVVGSLLIGTFMSPTFMLSFTGAACALLALSAGHGLNRWLPGDGLSAVGLAVLAATAHMAGQFMVAWQWFVPHPGLLTLLPVLMTAALVFGIATGTVTRLLLARLEPLSPGPVPR